MKDTRVIMGMPITIEIIDSHVTQNAFQKIFDYFVFVDQKFSPYKKESEVSKVNCRELSIENTSKEMKEILALSEQTKKETNGYFDVFYKGVFDPSGIVKGWAIQNAAMLIKSQRFENFFIDAGGDIQASGKNSKGKAWKIGIRNPFNAREIVKVLYISNIGVATSGTYERGEHIYNPHAGKKQNEIASVTVIGHTVYEADRFATAVFAMGKKGMEFLEKQKNLEGYMINAEGIATYTSGFEKYTHEHSR